MVYDLDVPLRGLDWEDAHDRQGFARRESVVNVGSLLELGHALVLVREGTYEARYYYRRVLAVPFMVTSGRVMIDGPEEHPITRGFDLPEGNYRLVVAQYVIWDDEQGIDLFFEPLAEPLRQSEVLVADAELNPTYPLLETAGIAGEH